MRNSAACFPYCLPPTPRCSPFLLLSLPPSLPLPVLMSLSRLKTDSFFALWLPCLHTQTPGKSITVTSRSRVDYYHFGSCLCPMECDLGQRLYFLPCWSLVGILFGNVVLGIGSNCAPQPVPDTGTPSTAPAVVCFSFLAATWGARGLFCITARP